MLDDGEVERRVRLAAADGADSLSLAALAHTHWERADRAVFAEAWERELVEIPPFTDSDLHIVTGLLLPIWKRLPDESMRVYRLQTDAGERVIGRLVSPAWVAQAVSAEGVSIAPADAWSAVLDGRTILELQDGLSLRRAKVMGSVPGRAFRLHRGHGRSPEGDGADLRDHHLEAPPVRSDQRRAARRFSPD